MKNLMSYYSIYGWSEDTNNGGYDGMAIGYLTSWLGPINESDDEYDDHSTLSPLLNSLFHIQNIEFLQRSNYTDNNAIKEAIIIPDTKTAQAITVHQLKMKTMPL